MSDEGEKTCPLCAEEMDLTDQQLKPCKCGYEICVWCWHHIMDMAEKDETEGRCPACRMPYNKEKIVGTTAKCERLVTEMNMEKKLKSHKAKGKTSEGRRQLSSVRVIQRNLVYIVGLPLNLADEDLLEHKEYFGQYGKVLKVSISRTTSGSIQHFANNTCSVYITYLKEEEAVRCIQAVHGFILEGRSLRACFGTTKYCHAWLRNMPCSNPDCLYLHEIGSQEDSFTKDEIISAYTRSRVQQITGASNNMQRRAGSVLPPPADEYCNNNSISLAKPLNRSAANNPANIVRGSPPNSSSGRSGVLPPAASWGLRASYSQAPAASLAGSNGPLKQKLDICNSSLASSTSGTAPIQGSALQSDIGKKLSSSEGRITPSKTKLEQYEFGKQRPDLDQQTNSVGPAPSGLPICSFQNYQTCSSAAPKDEDGYSSGPLNITNSFDWSRESGDPGAEDGLDIVTDNEIQDLCSDISLLDMDMKSTEPLNLSTRNSSVYSKQSDLQTLEQITTHEPEEELLSFDGNMLKQEEATTHSNQLRDSYQLFNSSNPYEDNCSRLYDSYRSLNTGIGSSVVNRLADGPLPHESIIPVLSDGCAENLSSNSSDFDSNAETSFLLPNDGKRKHVGISEGEVSSVNTNVSVDMGESSIISNILSMDFDPWDDSVTSPQDFARLLGETDKSQGSLGISSSRKVQNSHQSRFSFAREEQYSDQVPDFDPSFSSVGQAVNNPLFNRNFVDNRDIYFDRTGSCNGFSSLKAVESENISSFVHFPTSKLSVSKAQVSAPPGFSVPSRAPPPGFASHERAEQSFDNLPGSHIIETSSLLRNPYQAPTSGNISSPGDIEFMDPAILAVGKGRLPAALNSPGLDMRSNFSPQLNSFENEARLQLLMHRSLSAHPNHRFAEMGDSFSPLCDAYGISSRIMEQSLGNNMPPFSQLNLPPSRNGIMSGGGWNGWNEIQSGNDLNMAAGLLRTERLGYNKLYTGYEESKLQMPNSGNLYNRTFGI